MTQRSGAKTASFPRAVGGAFWQIRSSSGRRWYRARPRRRRESRRTRKTASLPGREKVGGIGHNSPGCCVVSAPGKGRQEKRETDNNNPRPDAEGGKDSFEDRR